MSNLQGARAKLGLIEFTPEIAINKATLDKAIAGGMKRAGLERAGDQLRDEIRSTVYLNLVTCFAKGTTPEGKLSSLAYKIARNVAIDTFRRPDGYDRRRAGHIDVADAVPGAGVEMGVETAEAGLLRKAEASIKATALEAALSTVSAADRHALAEMLKRREPLPRETAIERKLANVVAQREKRAKDRLREAVRSTREGAR